MKKRKLSYILAHTKVEKLEGIVEELSKKYEISKVKEPEMGLVMVKVKDGVYQEKFYIGEVLITECSVHLNGSLGMGIIQGDEPRKAYAMAVIDAVFNNDEIDKTELIDILKVWEEEIEDSYIEEKAMVEGSKVKFETMGE
jgi:alpha-D-ribose 1-methylphosphonate 5-triphosphate synthase subunit PhnG